VIHLRCGGAAGEGVGVGVGRSPGDELVRKPSVAIVIGIGSRRTCVDPCGSRHRDGQDFDAVHLGILNGTGEEIDIEGSIRYGDTESFHDRDVHATGGGKDIEVSEDLRAVNGNAEDALSGTGYIGFRKIQVHGVAAV